MKSLPQPPQYHRKPPRRPNARQQRGIAILTVLVIAVLVVTIAATVLARQSRAIRHFDNAQSLERAWQYVSGVEQLASLQLAIDAKTNKYDALTDRWAYEIPWQNQTESNGAVVKFKGHIEDMQGRFNLNNILNQATDQKGKLDPTYFTLLKKVVKKAELPEGFADVIADWEDSNTEPQNADGAERDYYSSGSIPYLAADMAFTDVSELRLLRLEDLDNDAKEAALKRFSSMVIALPFKQTTVNPNTASFTLLSALGLNSEQITTLKEKRQQKQVFKTKEAFFQAMGFQDNDDQQKMLMGIFDVTSQYFRLSGEININHARVFVNSLLFRDSNGTVRVIMRQFDRANEAVTAATKTTTD